MEETIKDLEEQKVYESDLLNKKIVVWFIATVTAYVILYFLMGQTDHGATE